MMQIEQVHKKEVERIINTMECPKDFICYKSGFEDLCKARDVGLEAYLECQEKILLTARSRWLLGIPIFATALFVPTLPINWESDMIQRLSCVSFFSFHTSFFS